MDGAISNFPEVVGVAEDDVAAALFAWVPSAEELPPTTPPGALADLWDPKAKEASGIAPSLELPANKKESGWADSFTGACEGVRLGGVCDGAADVTPPKLNTDPTEENEKVLLSCEVVACTDVTVEETAVTVFAVPCPEILLPDDVGAAVDAMGEGAHTEEGGVWPFIEPARGVCLAWFVATVAKT